MASDEREPGHHEPITNAAARSAFIGRRDELAEMRGALDALRAGTGSLFLLTGEPGIGKTRICEEVGRVAAAAGVWVLWGRCYEADGRPSYWPWAQAMQSCARHLDAGEIAGMLVPDALPVADLVPELRPHIKDADAAQRAGDPDGDRFRLFQSVAAVLWRVAAVQPMLLILDDLHWADMPSLRLLEFLAHELLDRPVMVAATFRELEVRRAPAVAEVVERLARRGRRLPLAGFTVEEVRRFVEGSADEGVAEELAERLQRDTEGNPFFIDEIVRQVRGTRGWSRSAALPVSHGVRSTIRERLAPLPDATRRLLSAAAVAGREFDLPLIEAALETARGDLLEQLAPALVEEIVTPIVDRPGRYRFAHALIRETVYEEVRPSDAVALHRRFGEILEARYGASLDAHLPELAHHFFAAAAGGAEAKALDYVERAGRQALRILAYEDAADYFQRALHLHEIGPRTAPKRECELLLWLGDATNRAGRPDESAKAWRRAAAAARQIDAPALLARAAMGLCEVGVGWAEFGRCDDILVRTLEEALDALPPDNAMLRAPVMARLATERFWTRPLAEVDALSRQAVELARRSGNDHSLAYTLMARIHCISEPDAFAERRALIDEVIALSGGRGKLAINAYLWRFGDELQFGDRADAHASGERLIRAVQERRQPRDLWLVPAVRSRDALLRGHFEEAERLAEEVMVNAGGDANAEQAYLAFLFMIRREQGRHGEMLGGLTGMAAQSVLAIWHAPLALLYAENGDAENGVVELDMMTRDGLAAVRRDLTWLFCVASLAAACSAAGSRRHAAALYEALRPYDGHTVAEGVFCYFGPVSYYLGVLATLVGDHSTAVRHLDDALAEARAVGARPFVARILLARAQAAEAGDGGDPAHAVALRREAEELARAMGMNGVASAAEQAVAEEAPGTTTAPAEVERRRAGLRREGDVWVVSYDGRSTRIKAVKGFVYLARLLASPGDEFHVLDLTRHASPADPAAPPPPAAEALGPILDARAKGEIRGRLADLRDELAEAERNNDTHRAAAARAEIEAIADTLAGAVGLGGRDRTQGADAERARASVTKALRAAIDRVARFDAALADVLSRTVKTGVFCSYVPLAQVPIDWEIGTATG